MACASRNPEPTPLLTDYTGYCIERFVSEFPGVGLYICPGETLQLKYAADWINNVIFRGRQADRQEPTDHDPLVGHRPAEHEEGRGQLFTALHRAQVQRGDDRRTRSIRRTATGRASPAITW